MHLSITNHAALRCQQYNGKYYTQHRKIVYIDQTEYISIFTYMIFINVLIKKPPCSNTFCCYIFWIIDYISVTCVGINVTIKDFVFDTRHDEQYSKVAFFLLLVLLLRLGQKKNSSTRTSTCTCRDVETWLQTTRKMKKKEKSKEIVGSSLLY